MGIERDCFHDVSESYPLASGRLFATPRSPRARFGWRKAAAVKVERKETKIMVTSRFRISVVCVVALSFFGLVYAHSAWAQVLYGSVTGTVTDQSGAGVPKAHAVLTNRATAGVRGAGAGDSGDYTNKKVPPGEDDPPGTTSGVKTPSQTQLMGAAHTGTD